MHSERNRDADSPRETPHSSRKTETHACIDVLTKTRTPRFRETKVRDSERQRRRIREREREREKMLREREASVYTKTHSGKDTHRGKRHRR